MVDKTAKLCQTCRELSLQDLYKGTPYYPLSRHCDLCELIILCLEADSKGAHSEKLPLIKLEVLEDEQDFKENVTAANIKIEVSHWLKRKLLERKPSLRQAVNLREYPFSLLNVYTDDRRSISLKASPVEGK